MRAPLPPGRPGPLGSRRGRGASAAKVCGLRAAWVSGAARTPSRAQGFSRQALQVSLVRWTRRAASPPRRRLEPQSPRVTGPAGGAQRLAQVPGERPDKAPVRSGVHAFRPPRGRPRCAASSGRTGWRRRPEGEVGLGGRKALGASPRSSLPCLARTRTPLASGSCAVASPSPTCRLRRAP